MTYTSDAAPHIDALDSILQRAEADSGRLTIENTSLAGQNAQLSTTIEQLRARIAELEAGGPDTPPPPPVDPPTIPIPSTPYPRPTLTSPLRLVPKDNFGTLNLDSAKDYIVELPTDRVLVNPRGLHIVGGRNVLIVGGAVDVQGGWKTSGTGPGVPENKMVRRAAYFQKQTGTVHLEGVKFISSTDSLSEGINIDAPAAKVQIVNVEIGTYLIGSKAFNHADGLQSWNGPRSMKVCGFHCRSNYQGMFLNPHDLGSGPVDEGEWEVRDSWIEGLPGAKYGVWLVSPPAKVKHTRLHVTGGLGPWDAAADWPDVIRTAPAEPYGWQHAGRDYPRLP